MFWPGRTGLLMVVPLLWVGGCDRARPEATERPKPVVGAETDEQVDLDVFAGRIADSISRGEPKPLRDAIDVDRVFQAASEGLGLTEGEQRNARLGFDGFAAALARGGAEGGTYRLLRSWFTPQGPRVLMRLTNPDGINYHLWHLRNEAGAWRIVDIELILTAERLSGLVRRMLLPVLARRKDSPLAPESPERLYVQNLHDVMRINRQVADGRGREALDLIASLPFVLRQSKPIMVQRLMAAHRLLQFDAGKAVAACGRRLREPFSRSGEPGTGDDQIPPAQAAVGRAGEDGSAAG